jgi:hypothetical protein
MTAPRKDSAPPIAVGQGAESSEAGNLRRKSSTGSSNEPVAVKAKVIAFPGLRVKRAPSIIAQHFCTCRAGAVCVFCLSWNRTITGIEARRQALGRRVRAGG